MDRRLAGEAEAARAPRVASQPCFVRQVERRRVEQVDSRRRRRAGEALARIEHRPPAGGRAQLRRQVERAERKRVDARAGQRDFVRRLQRGGGLDNDMEADASVRAAAEQVGEQADFRGAFDLRDHDRGRRRGAFANRGEIAKPVRRARRVDAQKALRPVLGGGRLRGEERQRVFARFVLAARNAVLEFDTDLVRPAGERAGKAVGAVAGNEDQAAPRARRRGGARGSRHAPLLCRFAIRAIAGNARHRSAPRRAKEAPGLDTFGPPR